MYPTPQGDCKNTVDEEMVEVFILREVATRTARHQGNTNLNDTSINGNNPVQNFPREKRSPSLKRIMPKLGKGRSVDTSGSDQGLVVAGVRCRTVVVVVCTPCVASSVSCERERLYMSESRVAFLQVLELFEFIAYLTGLNSNPSGSSDPWVAA
ncbi:hypothetical protein Taro_033685 [Colocasia esculenta]|uniref:Uncharacterized protein n=1 Tax=Colocasia esculenta TaxID=4460 RepID=A0A843W0T3_COLES|nr:hypothetical protein [Colocasia esculenta]